ncbi:MAG: efflux RND transporter permease subunit [Gemmataceae bacterium]|nr:efflux RND transporter permease subunit [Gemmataceae bacterium]
MRTLVEISLKQRYVMVVASIILLVWGGYLASKAPLDVFPEFAPPMIDVQTEAPGMSSEAVENLVSIPIESALNGIPHMTTLRSKSVQGVSQVVLIFERGADMVKVRQMVSERVALVATSLPAQVKTPTVLPPLSSTSRVLHIGLTPKKKADLKEGETLLDQTDVSVLMRFVIEPRLKAVPGVANISTYGQHDKVFQVLVKPEEMRAFEITLEQIKKALKDSVVHGSAGFHDTPNQRLAVQYSVKIKSPEDLARIVIAHRNGAPIYLAQVANLKIGNNPFIGEGVIQDEAGLFVVVEKFPWANTLDVTREVESAMESLKPSIPGVKVTARIFRPATFIEIALANLRFAMILGCILVSLILIAFLFEWRTAVISLTAIPLSIVSAVIILVQMNISINTMVLAGLAIAVGEVVDDAIIDVENIVRRLKENALKPVSPLPPGEGPGVRVSAFRVVLDASLEVRSAVVYASFIVMFVCLPIFFMSGVAGAFFRPLALAYVLAVMASLVVALIVTPALCLILLPRAMAHSREAWLSRWVRSLYAALLPSILRRPGIVYAILGVSLLAAGFGYTRLKEEFLPQFQETDFLMHWVAKPGTSLEVMTNDIKNVGREMLNETEVQEYGSHIARAEVGEEIYGVNFSELWVSLRPDSKKDYATARLEIERVMSRHPGFEHDLLTYLQERMKEVLSGSGASIVLRIYGPELDGLRNRAAEVHDLIAAGKEKEGKVEGVADLKIEAQVPVPQLHLSFNTYKMADYGLKAKEVADTFTTMLNGSVVAEVHQDQRKFDIVVRGHPDVTRHLPDLERLQIDLPGGKGTIPLMAIAEVKRVSAPNIIRHDKVSRCIDVTCNVKNRDLGSVVHDIQDRLKSLPQREGYRVEILGEYQARTESQQQLLWYSILALVGIAVLLYMDFQSVRLMLLVLFTLPFALIGGVAAAFATGGVLSLGSLVGFITVLGIAARNGIMLVSHYRHLQQEENMPMGPELLLRGAKERVVPILMTALAAGLGLLPLALGGNKPGYEVEYPMAIVILGGLITSTLLNLVLLPVLYGHVAATIKPERDAVV